MKNLSLSCMCQVLSRYIEIVSSVRNENNRMPHIRCRIRIAILAHLRIIPESNEEVLYLFIHCIQELWSFVIFNFHRLFYIYVQFMTSAIPKAMLLRGRTNKSVYFANPYFQNSYFNSWSYLDITTYKYTCVIGHKRICSIFNRLLMAFVANQNILHDLNLRLIYFLRNSNLFLWVKTKISRYFIAKLFQDFKHPSTYAIWDI